MKTVLAIFAGAGLIDLLFINNTMATITVVTATITTIAAFIKWGLK